jgi:uracil-DNA glycosylase
VDLEQLRHEIIAHPSNSWAVPLGYLPVYAAAPASRIVIVGQAPGARAQLSRVPWNDPSGVTLRSWLGVSEEQFYDPARFALLPMDFYYPGKGAHGDLPPRKAFAPLWHPRILEQLTDVALTILVGSYAQKHYLGAEAGPTLTATVGSFRRFLPSRLPLVHPSPLNFRWQRQNPWFATDVVPALRARVSEVLSTG